MRTRLIVVSVLSLILATGCAGGIASARAGAMPDGGTFTGVWFSPQYGEMHIVQTGATAIGRYEKGERKGRLQGGITGDLMRFEWSEKKEMVIGVASETKGRGYFRLVKDDVEDTWKLMGEWGHDQAEAGGGPWNAVKSKKRRAQMNPDSGSSSSGGSSSSDYEEEEEDSDDSSSDDLSDL